VVDIPNLDAKEYVLMVDECIRMAMGGRRGQEATGRAVRWCNKEIQRRPVRPNRKSSFLYDYPGVQITVSVPGMVNFSVTVNTDNKPHVVCHDSNWETLDYYATLLTESQPCLAEAILQWPLHTNQKLEKQSEIGPNQSGIPTRLNIKIILTHQDMGSRIKQLKAASVKLHACFLDTCGTFMKTADRQQLHVTTANTSVELTQNAVSLMDNTDSSFRIIAGTFSVRTGEGTAIATNLILQNILLVCTQHHIDLAVVKRFLFPDDEPKQQTGRECFLRDCQTRIKKSEQNFAFLLKELEVLLYVVLQFRAAILDYHLLLAKRYRRSMFTFSFLVRAHQLESCNNYEKLTDHPAYRQICDMPEYSIATAMYTYHLKHLAHGFEHLRSVDSAVGPKTVTPTSPAPPVDIDSGSPLPTVHLDDPEPESSLVTRPCIDSSGICNTYPTKTLAVDDYMFIRREKDTTELQGWDEWNSRPFWVGKVTKLLQNDTLEYQLYGNPDSLWSGKYYPGWLDRSRCRTAADLPLEAYAKASMRRKPIIMQGHKHDVLFWCHRIGKRDTLPASVVRAVKASLE
jgi:hypothetical protein